MTDIKNYEKFVKIELIDKGFSGDKKYYIETADGEKLLLRVSDIGEYELKKSEYDVLKRAADFGVLTNKAVDFGTCDNGRSVYQLLTWLDGEDIHSALPKLTETEQYILGIKSGELLRKIHDIPAPEHIESWRVRFTRKIEHCVQVYKANEFKSPHVEPMIKYLYDNINLLDSRPQTFVHGDFWVANLIMCASGEVGVIDFNFTGESGCGDPWFELGYTMPWEGSIFYTHYFTALFKGRFGGDPPLEFFNMLKYYYGFQSLAALCDIAENQGEQREARIKDFENVVRRFGEFKDGMPEWYLQDYHVQYIKDTPIYLTKPFDFSFLENYGEITKVVKHEKGAGNLCFCAENNGEKYFIKFAGAPVENLLDCKPEQVIEWLKEAKQIYQDLAHENLIKLVKSEQAGGGYVNIFEWVDAECIGYPSPPSRRNFLSLPTEAKMRAFDDILDFHAHVAEKDYVAIDFYADQILYNFDTGRTIICDIDFYQKSPYYGDKGTWGSSNFVSPEELIPGSRIDEISMVYAMGATAFCIFSDYERSREAWALSPELYAVAKRAVSDERSERHQSIAQFIKEWRGQNE